MRFLFVNQYFWPDEAPTGRLLEDLTVELAARGHEVTVVCGHSSYRGESNRTPPPATIIRVPHFESIARRRFRLLGWLSFLVFAGLRALFLPKADVVVAMTTPPAISLIGLALKVLRGSHLWIWEMDVYPDVAIATGVISQGSLFGRLVGGVIDLSRWAADGVVALGDCMKERLIQHGLRPDRIIVQQNWSEIEPLPVRQRQEGAPLRILYSGNFGMAHDFETIRDAIGHLRDHPSIQFVFAGGGSHRPLLEKYVEDRGIRNVEFLPHLSLPELIEQLQLSDLGLVLLKDGCTGTVVPSKFYTLITAGLPVLYIGPEDATPALAIEEYGCGWNIPPGFDDAVVNLLDFLAAEPSELRRATLATHTYRAELGENSHPEVLAHTLCGSPATVTPSARAKAAVAVDA